jgi:hypothetical protein
MMKMTGWIICLAPIGVCFLIAGQILQMQVKGGGWRSRDHIAIHRLKY